MTVCHPISAVAEILAVDARAVKSLIKSGALGASDVAPSGARYKKWRISEDDLQLFLARRAHTAPATRRRRRADPQVIQFF